METNTVYQCEDEIDRLATQNKLFEEYEAPLYQRVLSQHPHACILDIGSNNGTKLVDRFSQTNLCKAVGLEFHADLANQAQQRFGSQIFSFYHCDVEHPQFQHQLSSIMAAQEIEVFDIIHISLVLLHLRDPAALLNCLRRVLAPNGQLLIVEPADNLTHVTPDPQALYPEFMTAHHLDPYSGRRDLITVLPALLETCGYEAICNAPQTICAAQGEDSKKQAIFDIFCSYIKEDALLVSEEIPWAQWVRAHYDALEQLMIAPESQVTVGFTILTCSPKKFFFTPLTVEDIPSVCALCDQCVGENLYTEDHLHHILNLPDHHFDLLRAQNGALAGYTYSVMLNVTEMADYANLSPSVFDMVNIKENSSIIHLQAAGISPDFRNQHLSTVLVDHILENHYGADVAFGLCWRPNGTPPNQKVPMECALLSRGFVFLTQSQDVWAKVPDLICPYCTGVCHCSASAYYRTIHNK